MRDNTNPELTAEFERGVAVGLERARELVVAAPVLIYGERRAGGDGGVPRILDRAIDADGDPNRVRTTYALRDTVLHWIDKDLQRIDGNGAENRGSTP